MRIYLIRIPIERVPHDANFGTTIDRLHHTPHTSHTMNFAEVMSGTGLALANVLTSFFTKKRTFSTNTNTVDVNRIMKDMQLHTGWLSSELSVDGQWYPYWVISLGYCASLDVHSSQQDVHQQSMSVQVYRPCCMSWDKWDASIRAGKAGQVMKITSDKPELPENLTFIIDTSGHRSWSDYKAEDARAHSRNTEMTDLVHSMDLAKMVLAQVDANGGSGVFMIRGLPRTGKNAAGHIFAQMTNAIVCYQFNPTHAGRNLGDLIAARDQVDRDRPLLVLLDEADIMIKSLGKIPDNPTLKTEIVDKGSWNTWMERISTRKNVIVWMTSNDSDEQVLEYDSALLRQDRITAHYRATGGTGTPFVAVHELKVNVKRDAKLCAPEIDYMSHPSNINTPLLQG